MREILNVSDRFRGLLFGLFILFCIAVLALTSGCAKEQQPDYSGRWRTVNTISAGARWEYNFSASFCRSTPELGPTEFCNTYKISYSASGIDTFFIDTPGAMVWSVKLETQDLIRLQVLQTDGTMIQNGIYFLERK